MTQSEKDIYWWPLNNMVVIEFFLLVSLVKNPHFNLSVNPRYDKLLDDLKKQFQKT